MVNPAVCLFLSNQFDCDVVIVLGRTYQPLSYILKLVLLDETLEL